MRTAQESDSKIATTGSLPVGTPDGYAPSYVAEYELSRMSPAERNRLVAHSDGDRRLFELELNKLRFEQDERYGRLSPEADPVKLSAEYQAAIDRRHGEIDEQLGMTALRAAQVEWHAWHAA